MKKSINTRKLVAMGLMAGLSVALVFLIHFPIFPQAPFLEYDPADIPILIASFAYGPFAGLIVTAIASVVQGLTVSSASGLYGILMHLISTGTYVLVAGLIYRAKNSRPGIVIALVCGVLASAAVMAAANLVVTPYFMGVPVDAVKGMLLPVIIPFNLIKSGINAAMMMMIYLPLRPALEKFLKGK